jgi:hypothetical protein
MSMPYVDWRIESGHIVESLVGRTIVSASWETGQIDSPHDTAILYLDDGRAIEFGAWGHDDWGAVVEDITDWAPPQPPARSSEQPT